MTAQDQVESPNACKAKILEFGFNSPIVVNDTQKFNDAVHRFKTTVFVVYVDPKDDEKRKEVLEAMCEARRSLPI